MSAPMTHGLLLAWYGSTDEKGATFARGAALAAREALAARLGSDPSEVPFAVAVTSEAARRRIAAQGRPAPSVGEGLAELAELGSSKVTVAAAHLTDGSSYRRLVHELEAAAGRFESIRLAAPLLSSQGDVFELARALSGRYPKDADRTVVFVGHGADGRAQLPYLALEGALHTLGRDDAYVGTLRGRPDASDVEAAIEGRGARRVLLVPLMLAAGVHATRDIAGDSPESWSSRLSSHGFDVVTAAGGLAELPVTRDLIVSHALAAGPLAGSDAAAADRTRSHPVPAPGRGRFPLFIDIRDADCLVVGAGAVGTRRAKALARAGARVTLLDPAGARGNFAGRVDVIPRAWVPGDERGRALVVAATSSREVNRQIGSRCRSERIPVSVADAADECTFVFPALAESPGLVCGIVSTDNDHARVARAARAVREAISRVTGGAGPE